MTVVADSSPLIILARIGCFDYLRNLFPTLYISSEVHHEVVNSGTGLPGATEVQTAEWIEVRRLQNQAGLSTAKQKNALGLGELSTILLAKEVHADVVLLDDFNARKIGQGGGLRGSR